MELELIIMKRQLEGSSLTEATTLSVFPTSKFYTGVRFYPMWNERVFIPPLSPLDESTTLVVRIFDTNSSIARLPLKEIVDDVGYDKYHHSTMEFTDSSFGHLLQLKLDVTIAIRNSCSSYVFRPSAPPAPSLQAKPYGMTILLAVAALALLLWVLLDDVGFGRLLHLTLQLACPPSGYLQGNLDVTMVVRASRYRASHTYGGAVDFAATAAYLRYGQLGTGHAVRLENSEEKKKKKIKEVIAMCAVAVGGVAVMLGLVQM